MIESFFPMYVEVLFFSLIVFDVYLMDCELQMLAVFPNLILMMHEELMAYTNAALLSDWMQLCVFAHRGIPWFS